MAHQTAPLVSRRSGAVRPSRPARPAPPVVDLGRGGRKSHRLWAEAAFWTLLCALLLAFAPRAEAATTACPNAELRPSDGPDLRRAAAATRCLVNEERAARDLPPLRAHGRLRVSAARMAERLVAERFFGHVAPDGEALGVRVRRVGYPGAGGWSAGEDLAWGEEELATPAAIVRLWIESPPHRAVLLHPRYRDVGVGVRPGSPRGTRRHPAATYVLHAGWSEPRGRRSRSRGPDRR